MYVQTLNNYMKESKLRLILFIFLILMESVVRLNTLKEPDENLRLLGSKKTLTMITLCYTLMCKANIFPSLRILTAQ